VVESLPHNREALSSNPSTRKQKQKQEKKNKYQGLLIFCRKIIVSVQNHLHMQPCFELGIVWDTREQKKWLWALNFFFFAVLGFELRASCLLGKCSTP
jgi:hypothetical protein